MTGERSAYFTEMAERGARRVIERLGMIADRYGSVQLADVMTQAEAGQHMQDYGHIYDENCREAFCEKWRALVASAMTQMQAQMRTEAQGQKVGQ